MMCSDVQRCFEMLRDVLRCSLDVFYMFARCSQDVLRIFNDVFRMFCPQPQIYHLPPSFSAKTFRIRSPSWLIINFRDINRELSICLQPMHISLESSCLTMWRKQIRQNCLSTNVRDFPSLQCIPLGV